MIEVTRKPIESEITWKDLANPGPQISFDLAVGDQLPEGHELTFDTEKYGAYLGSRGLGDAQVNTARLTFASVSPPRLHHGSCNRKSLEMTVHVPRQATPDKLTRSVFQASEYHIVFEYIRRQLGEVVPRNYHGRIDEYRIGGLAIAVDAADLALRSSSAVFNYIPMEESLTMMAWGFSLLMLGLITKNLIYPPKIVRYARQAKRKAKGRPLVTIAPLKDATEAPTE